MRGTTLLALAVAAMLLPGLAGCKNGAEDKAASGAKVGAATEAKAAKAMKATATKDKTVKVEFYVMSKCPYGVQAVDGILPALEKLGSSVDFHLNYIVQENSDGSFRSLHGAPEVEGDILQLCAAKIAPKAYLKFIGCQNKDWHNIPKNWEKCAEEAGIDVPAMRTCKEGDEGKALLAASGKLSKAAKATGSPTIKVNGVNYRGGRKTNDFLRSICNELDDAGKPKVCVDLPKPPEVSVVVIGDKRCKKCKTTQVLGSLKQVFSGLKPRVLDWSDDEAKKIFKEAGLKYLPAVLFDDSVEKDPEGLRRVGRWLEKAGKYRSLRVGAKFDPTAEICDNKKDDTGNGLTDCADPTCKDSMLCRPDEPGRLDVFVMSQCPYGVKGLNAMKEVLDAFGKEMKFNIHYIANKNGDGFRSLHGQAEVDEDIRELCAMKHYAKNRKYMDYIWCRNTDIRNSDWKKCTGSNGISASVIEKCASGKEGKKLLAEDIKLADVLNIGASPTWLVNNRHTFSGISPQAIQKNFCEYNSGLKGCSKTLSSQSGPVKGSCGGK